MVSSAVLFPNILLSTPLNLSSTESMTLERSVVHLALCVVDNGARKTPSWHDFSMITQLVRLNAQCFVYLVLKGCQSVTSLSNCQHFPFRNVRRPLQVDLWSLIVRIFFSICSPSNSYLVFFSLWPKKFKLFISQIFNDITQKST